MRYLYKILRATAWLLVFATFGTLLTGFPNAPFLPAGSAYFYHAVVLPLVFVPLFFLHSFTGLLFLLGRHPRFNRKWFKYLAGAVWFILFVVFVWLYARQNWTAPASNTASAPPVVQNSGPTVVLSAAEIAKHNSVSDCWLIIDGRVYNVTSYLAAHPGGINTIKPYCGQDGSRAFATKNIGRPHSSFADNLLNSYLLGPVGQTVDAAAVQKIQDRPISNPVEYEDD